MIAIEIPKLEYSGISTARRYAVDMPYADPFDGAAYGAKRGPAIAIAGAIGSVSAGLAATNAFLGGLLIAGGIASGLGAITGNKTLSTIGGIASIASLATGSFTGLDGGFINPFSSEAGQGFANSVTGSAFKSVFSDIKSGLGIGDNLAGTSQVADAAGSAAGTLTSGGAENLKFIDGVAQTTGGKISNFIDGAKDVASGLMGKDGILNNQGMLGLIGGLGEGYGKMQELEQMQPLTDARVANTDANTNQTNLQTGILAQRQQNLQFQPNAAGTVNQDQQVFSRQPGINDGAQKYAVVMNGKIQYVSQAEYDAMRQNQGVA